jgi:putative hydrolase of HD superfamily
MMDMNGDHMNERLKQQMNFLIEIDKLKSIFRQSHLIDGTRNENDTEHSWHIAVMAMILAEYSNEPIDVLRVIKMLLIHDVVEIDAGDTYAYDVKGYEDKYEREIKAADRLFGLLPEDMHLEMRGLWDEFETCESAEARYANALDRVQPILLNYLSGGKAWMAHGIRRSQVMARNEFSKDGSEVIWAYILEIINDAVDKGYIVKG